MMVSVTLTPGQSTLLDTMRQALVSERYQNFFQATFPPGLTPSIVFLSHTKGDLLTLRGTLSDFLALVQQGAVTITNEVPTAYWGHLTYLSAPTLTRGW